MGVKPARKCETSATGHVLAIASSGGHWSQLMLLADALDGHRVTWATTLAGLGAAAGIEPRIVPDCNRNTPVAIVRATLAIARLVREVRPDAVVTTGAMPGLLAVAIARASGRRTVWVESIANVEQLSMSGRIARRVADEVFVQWPDLARRTGTRYAGAVL